jgi:inorganic triphosphatase YgiF
MKTSPPQETELKLRLPGLRAEKAVLQALQQHGYKINDLRIIRNADLYLDSYSWLLLKKKWALRYRLANGQAQYTLKSIGGVIDGLAQRDEIEVALKRPLNDPRNIPAKTIRDKLCLDLPQNRTLC